MRDYSDIIGLSRPKSRRPSMSIHDRAAQFAPFAALTGHDAALAEVARQTDERRMLSDDEESILNREMALLRDKVREHPHIKATFFVSDSLKEGGSYKTVEGNVRAIDDFERRLALTDGREVPIADIVHLEID